MSIESLTVVHRKAYKLKDIKFPDMRQVLLYCWDIGTEKVQYIQTPAGKMQVIKDIFK